MIFADGEPPKNGERRFIFVVVDSNGEHCWNLEMDPRIIDETDAYQAACRLLLGLRTIQRKIGTSLVTTRGICRAH